MSTATLTTKGQTTIPKDIRDRLGLKPGDRLDFTVMGDGSVRVVPATVRLEDLAGMLPKPKRPRSIEEINRAIEEGWGRRWRRSR